MLLDKLIGLIDEEDEQSFFALKNLLSIAASALPTDGSLPRNPKECAAFRHVQRCLYELRKSSRPRLSSDGILWRGRPDFVTDGMLGALVDEVEQWRPRAEIQKWGQYISPGGERVKSFANSVHLRTLVTDLCGEMEDQNYPSCLYYDSEGAHIKPHVDTDNFCVNVNLMLRHSSSGKRDSALVIYPYDDDPKTIVLEPGEILIMYADCVVHTRTPVARDEVIRNITFGYRPRNEIHQLQSDRKV